MSERLLVAVREGGSICDDCLAKRLGYPARQQANQQARRAEGQGRLERGQGECRVCGSGKLVNWIAGEALPPGNGENEERPHEMTALPPGTHRIVLVSCVKSKREWSCAAEDLYTSPLFREARRWALLNGDEWWILSAKHGLLAPSEVIAPYEQTLKGAGSAAKHAWARKVWRKMGEAGLLRPGVGFLWLAGMDYQQPLRSLLADYPHEYPLEGMAQGVRVSWLQRKNGVGR